MKVTCNYDLVMTRFRIGGPVGHILYKNSYNWQPQWFTAQTALVFV